MDFKELYSKVVLTERGILELVDEYTLYCHYTGIEDLRPNRKYHVPYYREDNSPSFGIFKSTKSEYCEYMWKDLGTGESGTIFRLIQKIEGLRSTDEVLALINEDFGLGFDLTKVIRKEKIRLYQTPPEFQVKIRIVERPLTVKGEEYWKQFRIDKALLDMYHTSQVEYYWTHEDQEAPVVASDPTFAYRIGRYYQLYSPFAEKQYKFRNDYPENYFFGFLQLPDKGDVLVIDKSAKDVIFCRRLGIYAVCGKSETTMIPHDKMMQLKDRFTRIYLMLDDDRAGRKTTEKYTSMYPWLRPRFLWSAKDKTDSCLALGFDETEKIVKQIINE